jgi:glycosyltransferase involved in cell wall biosynthesis
VESQLNELLLPDIDCDSVDLLDLNQNHAIVSQILWTHFDAAYYTARYTDIDLRLVDPLMHYCCFGWKEGRDPCPTFSTQRYLDAYADVAALGINPFLHWLLFGKQEGRTAFPVGQLAQPSAFELTDLRSAMAIIADRFNAAYYRKTYADMDHPGANQLAHFCMHGWREKRNPAEWFSTALYLAHHADVAANDINPFVHYIRIGEQEQRRIFPANYCGPRPLVRDATASLVTAPELQNLIRLAPAAPTPPAGTFDAAHLRIHWVIPNFQVGSGGHMTIFRIVHLLEQRGHACTIWIDGSSSYQSGAEAYDVIVKHFVSLRAAVALTRDGFDVATGDIVFATGWQTVTRVCAAGGFRERVYLVQDFEPAFYAVGSQYLAAEATYSHDLACICASPWLATTMRENYGRWARHFWLAYDTAVYFPGKAARPDNEVPRIAVYARTCTARRSVEMVLLALERLAADGVAFHADLFGGDLDATRAPFAGTSHGVLDAAGLAALYRACDLGICFSTTNYSLVPKEMMACGLPVLEIDRPSTRCIFPPEVVTLSGPDPLLVAADIKALLADRARRAQQAKAAADWIAGFSWAKSAGMIEAAMVERLTERGHARRRPARPGRKAPPFASVCIPTYNGGQELLRLLDLVRGQRAPWRFEIVVVDSSSSDGTAARMRDMPDITFHSIPKRAFGHGKTRNLCAQLARGEAIAFLTQDAMPANDAWLFNLVSVLMHFPQGAGAFGRHIAAPSADPFTVRDLEDHFAGFLNHPIALSRATRPDLWESGDAAWRRMLHFYSDNNSCLRRSVWEQIPYPDVEYGEDQVWADRIIAAGWEKIYVPAAVVRHSHDYTPAETRARAAVEAKFFREQFGHAMLEAGVPLSEQIARANRHDRHWAKMNGVSADAVARRCANNEARLAGYNDDRLKHAARPPDPSAQRAAMPISEHAA